MTEETREAPMTIGELKRLLSEYPDETRVFTPGYEGGYHDGGKPRKIRLNLNVNDKWHYGPHEPPYDDESYDVEGVVLQDRENP